MLGYCGQAVIFDTASVIGLVYWFADGGWVKAVQVCGHTAGTLCEASEPAIVGSGWDTKQSDFTH